jgi:hypothetical protein
MNERMYWGLLFFVLIALWFLLGEIRRYIFLRMQLNAKDLFYKERVAAIAAARPDLPENDYKLTGYTYAFAWPPSVTKKKILLLCGTVLIMGGMGGGAALYWSVPTHNASFSLIPVGIGVALLAYLVTARLIWK